MYFETGWQFSLRGRGLCLALMIGMCVSETLYGQRDREEGESFLPEQVLQIDRKVAQVWQAYELEPAAEAPDNEWCRRVYLDVLGRIPTVEELDAYVADDAADKKAKLVHKLLYDDTYTVEFARNWTTIWSNLLIGRTGGTARNSAISREGMQKYLRDSFARGKPYDRMVYELITATGSVEPGSDDFNGATNFLIDKVNADDAAQATAATTRLFLGLQVQCTQCHNHPFNEWKQKKYWEMNAFFRQTRAVNAGRGATRMGAAASLVDRDFRSSSGSLEEAEIYYELRNGEMKVAYPVFVDGTAVDPHGQVERVNRRQRLGELVRNSPYLERTLVNRMWGHFLGYGFTKPVDDLGPHNPPSHPELLEYLAGEFRDYGFDIRKLITWIALSRAYGLSSRISEGNSADDPTAGVPPRFARFYLRQMRAEELYESLLVATQAEQTAGSYAEQERQKNRWLQQFSQAFGTDEGDEITSFNGTIPQVLMMFNGDLMVRATQLQPGSLLEQVASNSQWDAREKINYLFRAGLARDATPDELRMAQQIYAAHNGNAVEAFRDLWWVVLNSNEFIFNR